MAVLFSPLANLLFGVCVDTVKQGIDVRKKKEELESSRDYVLNLCVNDAQLSAVGYMKDRRYHYLLIGKSILYDFEDFMEDYNNHLGEPKKVNWAKTHLLFQPSCVKQFPLKYDMGGRITDLNKRIKKFKKHEKCIVPKKTGRPCFSSVVDESKILGRDKEKSELIQMLGCSGHVAAINRNHEMATATTASSSSSTTVPVIFITGPTGYGKTALAQLVIKDTKVKEHFKKNIYWVSVSGPINDKKRLAIAIIKALEGTDALDYYEWNAVHLLLRDCIEKKEKMLLVLDDSCAVDNVTWTELKLCLDAAAPGSRILVTSQLTNLSAKMGIVNKDTLPLSRLRDEDAWVLLRDTALPGQSEERIREFERTGKELAKGCQGVPFVVEHLGYALRTKETPQEWKAVLGNCIWNLKSVEGLLPPLLDVIYDDFDEGLQRCFKYCACLPYDIVINRGNMVKTWMALGFLVDVQAGQTEEEKGDIYFNLLQTHSFLHVSEPGVDVDNFKFYPHVYALLQPLSGNESCYYDESGTSSCKHKLIPGDDTRYSTIILRDNDTAFVPARLFEANKLRALKIKINKWEPPLNAPSYVFSQFLYLRALDMSYTGLIDLAPEVSNLTCLKILILSGSCFQKLPDTVCDLRSLQTLILNDCEELTKLPQNMGQLTALRHLEIKNTPELKKFPEGFGKLIELKTLSKFVVAPKGLTRGAKIGELKLLNSLQGHLEIKGLDRVKSSSDAKEAALVDKIHLQSLSFDFGRNLSLKQEKVKTIQCVFEALKPVQGVKVELSNYPENASMPTWWPTTTNECEGGVV